MRSCTVIFFPITLKYAQLDRPVSQLSVAKNRIDLSCIGHFLEHLTSKKPKICQKKLNAFRTLLKKGNLFCLFLRNSSRYFKNSNRFEFSMFLAIYVK